MDKTQIFNSGVLIAGQVSPLEVRSLCEALLTSTDIAQQHSSLLALALAAALSLEGGNGEEWTGLMKQEQQLTAVSTEGSCASHTASETKLLHTKTRH